jgi:hypothetical protein
MDLENEIEGATLGMVRNFKEVGGVLAVVGLTSLFVWLTMQQGAYIAIAALIFGGGFRTVGIIVEKIAGKP